MPLHYNSVETYLALPEILFNLRYDLLNAMSAICPNRRNRAGVTLDSVVNSFSGCGISCMVSAVRNNRNSCYGNSDKQGYQYVKWYEPEPGCKDGRAIRGVSSTIVGICRVLCRM